jgi:hypothetical protein
MLFKSSTFQDFSRATIDKLNRELDQEKVFQYKVTGQLLFHQSISLMRVHLMFSIICYSTFHPGSFYPSPR